MDRFSKGISRSKKLPEVFFEGSSQRLPTIRGMIQKKKGKLSIADHTGMIPKELQEHASYTTDWLTLFTAYQTGQRQPALKETPAWWRAGLDDVTSFLSVAVNTDDRSFKAYYAHYNRLERINTRVLADSWTNVALVRRVGRDEEAFVVPLHLTVLADRAPDDAASPETVCAGGTWMPTCLPYPALSSLLDVYSNHPEKLPADECGEGQPQVTEHAVQSWYPAVNTGIQHGVILYRQKVLGDRHWPQKLYFRWAIDLSSLYDAHYLKPEIQQEECTYIELKDRLVGGGSGGAAFALAAAQALARADRRGEFTPNAP